ncbi:MAG: undecaprenyl/decaprenyl-phosphate alpha-N-acetylglucosaminyl 1-phosphate transferase [Patescibacteria group bacterium]|nr:undecaprenyl/decaprenyl-phosphate alpha-N-acetylglucosaminyl 1-phosphate transferase [Patescibacteria group bacterium]
MDYLKLTLFPLFVSLLATTALTPLTISFAKKLGLLDNPKRNHPGIIHKKPIPRGGGIPFLFGILIACFIFLPLTKLTIAIFISSLICLVIGVLDDKYDLSPYLRFSVNILVAVLVVGAGIGIPFLTNPAGGIFHLGIFKFSFDFFGIHTVNFLSDFLAIVWIVWVMNMLNWSKGVDGQMPGIVAISAIIIGLLSLRFGVLDTNALISAKLAFAIAGASLGFLFFNFYPAKIFPGYGATSIYLLLAIVSILSSVKLATAILVMGVPMIDGVFTILRRISTGRSPFWHDKKHLHHLLLNMGLTQRKIALLYWLFSAILGLVSLTLTSTGKLFAIIMLIVIVGGAILSLHFISRKNEKIPI